jgi:hypothetical protein
MNKTGWFLKSATLLGSALACFQGAYAGDIQLNGFGSVYGAKSIGSDAVSSPLYNDKVDFTQFTRFGLNVGARLADDMDAAAQFVVSGRRQEDFYDGPSWNLYANWAFLNYHPGNLTVKLGRQLYPAWLAAEYLDVGFLQPYRTLPESVISLMPYRGFDGLTLGYKFDLGFAKLYAAAFGGKASTTSFNYNGTNRSQSYFDASNIVGGTFTLTGDGFRLHGMISRSSVTGYQFASTISTVGGFPIQSIIAATNGLSVNTTSATAGLSYDKHNIVFWGEYGMINSNDAPSTTSGQFLKSAKTGYALLGYRLGALMPRYMISMADYSQLGFSGLGKLTTHNIGANYQLNEKAVLKVDFQMDQLPGDGTATFVTATNGATSAKSASVGVDFVF